MDYISTRSLQHTQSQKFCQILLEGLAPDGGLYLPQEYPKLNIKDLAKLRTIYQDSGYASLAFHLLSLYIDDIPATDLDSLCRKTYNATLFGIPTITPLKKLANNFYIQALSNGPTLAFKDIAMQLLGHLFEYELYRKNRSLNILGATSGDTGSAAEYAIRGKHNIRVFMLSPHGRMSAFQRAQMYSLLDENIHNIAIQGVFDDCQDIVKAIGSDLAFKQKYRIGTVNSINWARLLAQVVYYFAGYFQATKNNTEKVSFTVPSGNFGNVCAGHIARSMGLPIKQLVVATNENDVLDVFFRSGTYRTRDAQNTLQTSSPSMDISKASNFERFIFDLLDRDNSKTHTLFTKTLQENGQITLSQDLLQKAKEKYGFASGKSIHTNRLDTIRLVQQQYNTIIDPHTADGIKVALEHKDETVPMIVLETAQAIKFASTISEALGYPPKTEVQFQEMEKRPQRVKTIPADTNTVKRFIQQVVDEQ